MPTIIENRRNLHQIPEIELTTQKTSQYIENVLDLYDCKIDHPIPNSVTAFFDNKKEKTIVFRSDMDALPMDIRLVYCGVQMVIFRVICGGKSRFSDVSVWFFWILLSWCYHTMLFVRPNICYLIIFYFSGLFNTLF